MIYTYTKRKIFIRILKSVLIIFVFLAICPIQRASAGEANLITISQGIEKVLKDNRLIKVTLPNNEIGYQDSLISRSALLPHLDIAAAKTYYKFQPATKSGTQRVNTSEKNPFSFSFGIYQTIFDFGKSLSNYRASKELLKATEANTESIKRVATLEFVVSYFDLLEAEKMITVFEKEVESLNAYLNDIEHLYKQGAAVKNDLLPAKVKLADARQKLIASRNLKEVSAARLNNILAFPLRDKITPQDIKMENTYFPEIENAWETAQAERPEVNFYEDQIQASVQSEKAKAVENFPVIFVDGGYNYAQNKYQVRDDNMSIALGAKVSLFDGGASIAQLHKERVKQGQLKEQKNKLVEDIKFEVEDSYFGLKDACEKVSVARDALEQSDENVRFYRAKYNSGSATSTDVLEAITLQTRAQTNYYSDDYELKRSYAQLMYSMGIDLWLIYAKMESGENGAKQ